jgi:hypothetical protein
LRRIRATDPTSATIILPPVALACAARETLHLGDVVEDMLRKAMTVLMTNDRKLVAEVSRMYDVVDRLDEAIKLYVKRELCTALHQSGPPNVRFGSKADVGTQSWNVRFVPKADIGRRLSGKVAEETPAPATTNKEAL